MKLNPVTMLVAASALATSGAALSEDKQTVLTQITNPVMVNQGESYVDAQEGMLLYPGDQLMVMNGGSAQINYATGCVHQMGGNEIHRISSEDACSTPAAAAVNQAAPSSPPAGGAPAVGAGMGTGNMIGLGLTLGALTYAGVEIADDNDSDGPPPDISP